MKRLLLALALVLSGAAAEAQIVTPPDTVFSGGDLANPLGIPDGAFATPGLYFNDHTTSGIYWEANHAAKGPAVSFKSGGNQVLALIETFTGSNPIAMVSGELGIVSLPGTTGTFLIQDDGVNHTLALGGGQFSNVSQIFRIYNTKTDATNYERANFDWRTVADTFILGTSADGTGTGRDMHLQVDGTNIVELSASAITGVQPFLGQTGTIAGGGITAATMGHAFSGATQDGVGWLSGAFGGLYIQSQGPITNFVNDPGMDGTGIRTNLLMWPAGTNKLDLNYADASNNTARFYSTSSLIGFQWQNSAADGADVYATANTIVLDADRDDDGDGTITLTTDAAAHTLEVDSFGVDIISDSGFNVDITDGTDVLDMHFNVLGSPTINVQLDNGTESNAITWSGVALTIDGDQDNNGTGNMIIGGGDIAITEDASGGDSTALVFAAPSGANTLTLPASTGTVALLSDITGGGPTRVSQAANLSTSALYSSAAATDLLFAPANSTEYHITGKVFVSSSATAHGLGYQFTWPTTDAIAGACSPLIQTSTTAHSYVTQEAASGATNGPISGASSPAPAGTVTVHTIDCYLSTTTTTSGNFAILFGGENGTSTFVLYAGSYIDYEALP